MGDKNERINRGQARQQAPKRSQGGGGDSEFINYELTKAEKGELKGYCMDPIDLDAELEGVINYGAKITVKYDERNNCYVAFGFVGDDHEAAGHILTGRGGSVSRSLRQLAFKHHHVLGGDWLSYHNLPAGDSEDDW
jgi:hypothetical protein